MRGLKVPLNMESQEKVWDKEYRERGAEWSRRVMQLPDVFEGKVVLEVGVGDGKTLASICEKKPEKVFAIDFSGEALKKAEELHDSSIPVEFIKADVKELPFRDDEFDVIVLYYVLNNMLEEDRRKTINELSRVLKSDGLILFEDFAVGDFRETTAKRTGMPEPHTLLKNKGLLCHYFTLEEVKELFGEFSKVDVELKERTPIRNKEHLVRKTITGLVTK